MIKDRKKYNEYMRKYHLERYYRIKSELLLQKGGKCVLCGSEKNLEFDHIKPKEKSFSICDKLLTFNIDKIKIELKKCQLLCEKCHQKKTIKDLGKQEVKGKNVHGTLSSYRYCKCKLCKEVKSKYMKKYKRKSRRKTFQNSEG